MEDVSSSAAEQPARRSLDRPDSRDITKSEEDEEEMQDVDFGEVDLAEPGSERGNREETDETVEPAKGEEVETEAVSSDVKKNNRRVTMAFRSYTPANASPANKRENFTLPANNNESEVHSGKTDDHLDLEPVSLEEDAGDKQSLKPASIHVPEQPSPSLGSKLGLTTALGYATSLLPNPSPSKTIDRPASPAENASAGPSRTSSYASLTPMGTEPVPVDPTKVPAASSWTSSISNYFGSNKSASPSIGSPLPNMSSPFRKEATRPVPERNASTSTAFILQNLDATKEERRQSVEAGGSDALREGFERVKRDSTRLREAAAFGDIGEFEEDEEEGAGQGRRRSSVKPTAQPIVDYSDDQEPQLGPDGVDWPFWGCVMNDYEAIARSRPRDLSRAIQQGIPAVVRGTIWQLMSSSKNVALEATYAGLLKEKSPHSKAIQKDLARTLPGHRYFAQGGGVGQENLFNVVKAYSL